MLVGFLRGGTFVPSLELLSIYPLFVSLMDEIVPCSSKPVLNESEMVVEAERRPSSHEGVVEGIPAAAGDGPLQGRGSQFQPHYSYHDQVSLHALSNAQDVEMAEDESRVHQLVNLAATNPDDAFNQLFDLIESGMSVNAYDCRGETALYVAAEKGLLVTMEQLIAAGAPVSAVNKATGDSVLHGAVRGGSQQCVKSLLGNYKVDINLENFEGDAPIHVAVLMVVNSVQEAANSNRQTRENILDLFLGIEPAPGREINLSLLGSNKMTPVNVMIANGLLRHVEKAIELHRECVQFSDGFGDTPIHTAARCGYFDLVQKMVEIYPDGLQVTNKAGETPITTAACSNNSEISEFLSNVMMLSAAHSGDLESLEIILDASQSSENHADANGDTAAHLAARQGHVSVIERLVQSSVFEIEDISSCRNDEGDTPLHLAAWKGHDDIVELLLQATGQAYQVAVGSLNNAGMAPVHIAARLGHENVLLKIYQIELGLSMKPEVSVMTSKDARGMTALHHATIKSRSGLVQALLMRGSNANEKDNQGKTPLYWAASSSNLTIMRYLLECGGDPLVEDAKGRTPFDISKRAERPVLNLLAECLLFRSVESGRLYEVQKAVQQIESAGEDITHVQDFAGSSAIHVAARGGHAEIVKWLAQRPGFTRILNDVGEQPIHVACKAGKLDCVDALLSTDVTLGDSVSSDGDTPLHIVARQGCTDIIKLLVNTYKLPTETRNQRGNTALHEAICSMQYDPIEALLDAGADANAKETFGGNTPLHLVGLWCSSINGRAISNLLLRYHANPALKNVDGQTAEQLGQSNGNSFKLSFNHIIEAPDLIDVQDDGLIVESENDMFEEELDSLSMPSTATSAIIDEEEQPIEQINLDQNSSSIIKRVCVKDEGITRSPFSAALQPQPIIQKTSSTKSTGDDLVPESEEVEELEDVRSKYAKLYEALYIKPEMIHLFKNHMLGEGSFGVVYLGVLHGNKVAVKIFKQQKSYNFKHISEDDFDSTTRAFLDELHVMADLRHDNIQSIRGYTNLPEGNAIVSAYYDRGSLVNILQKAHRIPQLKEEMNWSRRLKLAKDINKGMMCMHNQSVPRIHRDLKAANCFVDERWTAYVGDFGFTCLGTSCSQPSKDSGPTNPRWLAPELLQDSEEAEFSPASDVYSFGMILYELLTWKPPFKDKTIEMCYNLINGGKRPEIPNLLPGDKEDNDTFKSSGALELYIDLMKACWSQKKGDRPDTNELYSELRAIERTFVRFSQSHSPTKHPT